MRINTQTVNNKIETNDKYSTNAKKGKMVIGGPFPNKFGNRDLTHRN